MTIKSLIADDFPNIVERALASNSESHAELEFKWELPQNAVPKALPLYHDSVWPALHDCGAFSLSDGGEFGHNGTDVTRNIIYDTRETKHTPAFLLSKNGVSCRARGESSLRPSEVTVKLRGKDKALRPEFTLRGVNDHFNGAVFAGMMKQYEEINDIFHHLEITSWLQLEDVARFLTQRKGHYARFMFSKDGEVIPAGQHDRYRGREVEFDIHIVTDIIQHYKSESYDSHWFDADHNRDLEIIKTEAEIEAELDAPRGGKLSDLVRRGVTPEMVFAAFQLIEHKLAQALGAYSNNARANYWDDCKESEYSKGERAVLLAAKQMGKPLEIGFAPAIGACADMLRPRNAPSSVWMPKRRVA